MAWTELTRAHHRRETKRYPSDLTDAEWTIVRPLLPSRNRLGRPREVKLRRVWNAIQYIAASGCAWSLLPKDFPPVSTVRYYFYRWRDDGLLAEINRHLVAAARLTAGRDVQPTAGVIDNQSVKSSENTSLSGYDAGKRIKGRKRHIITDTCGNLIACEVHTANIQDRDGAPRVFAKLRREAPKLRHMFADGGYAGPKLQGALVGLGRWTLDAANRQAVRYRQGLRGATSQMGRGTDFRMARAVPPISKGLGEIHRECRSLGPDRPYPTHDEASCKRLKSLTPF